MATTALSDDEIARAIPHVHDAIENLIKTWDALSAVERIVGFEITTEELSDLAGGLDTPAMVRNAVSVPIVTEWLQSIQFVAK